MSPPYLFRIDEIGESPNAVHMVDSRGNWIPSTDIGANIRTGGGVSGILWYCNGQRLAQAPGGQLPTGSRLYRTYSTYYSGGYGFWILMGDATSPPAGENWHPLRFDYDQQDYSSYVTNAGLNTTLYYQRTDQRWPRMLLPDIYHTTRQTPHQAYGGLIGDLPIFLALLTFSVTREALRMVLPSLFTESTWRTHGYPHGRVSQRGVVVYVYTAPESWAGGSSADDLRHFEEGHYGKYFP